MRQKNLAFWLKICKGNILKILKIGLIPLKVLHNFTLILVKSFLNPSHRPPSKPYALQI